MALPCALDIVSFITTPAACAALKDSPKYMFPFGNILFVLVNGSHGLGFTCKFALVALLLTEDIVGMICCRDPELDPWLICTIGVVVLGAATTHTAELYLRRSYVEKVRADAETVQGWAEEAGKRRQLEERMEQMVSDRVATMNENIPITQHQAILREKLSESEARAVALRQEL